MARHRHCCGAVSTPTTPPRGPRPPSSISDFDGLHSRKHNHEVQFYAFDILVSDGEDVRKLPLSMRKTNLAPNAGAAQIWFLERLGRTRRSPCSLENAWS